MNPVIVGVDPGTTSAYSVLDASGDLITVQSSRNFDLSTMISEIIQHGNPVVVGCDKNPAPSFVEKLATKVGAELVWPEQDLQVDEKRNLVDVETRNDHEFDAYASAKYAFKQYQNLLRRVEEVLEDEGKEELTDELKYLVVKEDMSIKEGIEYLERDEEESSEEENPVKVKVVRPENEIEELEKEITLLEQKNQSLKSKVEGLREENQKLKDRIKGMPVDQVVKEKENTIQKLGDKLEKKEETVEVLNEKIGNLKNFLEKSSNKVLLKKLENLGKREFEEKNWRIYNNDILYVKDPNVAHDDVIDELKDKVSVIVHDKKLSVKHSEFSFIQSKDIELEELDDFALTTQDEIEEALSQKNILEKVAVEYKKKRKR